MSEIPNILQDDYVKFIRWGQWRIEQTGNGILAFITNHSYLDNPTFRGMRQSLMHSFDEIYLLNLHGNTKKKEVAPDGSRDDNLFDIQQGVAISIFVKRPHVELVETDSPLTSSGNAQVKYADLWGKRDYKYQRLLELAVDSTDWTELNPQSPFYLFIPQNVDLLPEYERGWQVTDIFPINVLGFQTHRDHFAIDFDRESLYQRINDMRQDILDDEQFIEKYKLRENNGWQVSAST